MFDLRYNTIDVKHVCKGKAHVLFNHPEIKPLQVTARGTVKKNLFLDLEVMPLFVKVQLVLKKSKCMNFGKSLFSQTGKVVTIFIKSCKK